MGTDFHAKAHPNGFTKSSGFHLSNHVVDEYDNGILTQVEFSSDYHAKIKSEHDSVTDYEEECKIEPPDKQLPGKYQSWLDEVREFMPKFRHPESKFDWLDKDDICNICLTLIDKYDDITEFQRQELMGYLNEITDYTVEKSRFFFVTWKLYSTSLVLLIQIVGLNMWMFQNHYGN